MTVRSRRKISLGEDGEDVKDALLERDTTVDYAARKIRRQRNCWNYCVFGGISGLTILAILLTLNLVLTFATLIWSSDVDTVLFNWGRPGSGTESLAWYPTDFTRDILPIPCHSHNDYWRRVPLFSALRAGCTGVEADVWLFDDELYVGHNTASLTRNRTFTSLYIDPLVKILEDQNPSTPFYNGTGHGVFDVDPGQSLTLLVDVKTDGEETWPWVVAQLQPLRERGWLSFFENGEVHMRQITVVGTGNTPFDILTANSTYRDTFFDAPLDTMWEPRQGSDSTSLDFTYIPDSSEDEDLDPTASPTSTAAPGATRIPQPNSGQGQIGTTPDTVFNQTNSFYASVSFDHAVGRIWRGRLSPRQMKIIRGQIRGAHRRGLKARYWDLPAWPLGLRNHVWNFLVREYGEVGDGQWGGMLNVDDLRGASRVNWSRS